MANIVFSANAPKVKGFTSDNVLQLEVTEHPETVGGTRTPFTVDDRTYDEVSGSTVFQHAQVTVTNISLDQSDNVFIESPDHDQVSVNNGTLIDNGSYGVLDFKIGLFGYSQQILTRSYTSAPPATYDVTGFTTGSLSAHCKEQIESLISGYTPGRDTQEYLLSTNNHIDNPDVTISDHPFISQFDMTGVSVMRSSIVTEDAFPAILVSPRHVLAAKHVAQGVGNQYAFKRSDGSYQVVTVQAKYDVASGQDLSVMYLDAPVTGCKIYKTMPYNWEYDYAPSLTTVPEHANSALTAIPYIRKALHLNSDVTSVSCILVNHLYLCQNMVTHTAYDFSTLYNTPTPAANPHTVEINREWGRDMAIGGDSGGPSFLVIDGDLVLISAQQTTVATTNFSAYTDEINTAMNDMAGVAQGTYVLTHPDLSAFNDYGA